MIGVLPIAGSGGLPRLGRLAEPRPGPGEALVEVRATAVNWADLLQLRGQYPPPPGEPEVPGLECAGEILEVARAGAVRSPTLAGEPGAAESVAEARAGRSGRRAPADADWRPGDRVMALLGGGGHAERVAVPAGQLLRLPEGWEFAAGAAVPEAALTAWTNLVPEGGLRAGETVLVSGATGGVGSFAVQMARELGARVIAAARAGRRLDRLAELGVEERVEEGPGLAAAVADLTGGRGVDLVLELVGGPPLASHLATLAPGGRLVLVGLLAGPAAELDLGLVLRRRLRIVGSVLRPRPRAEKATLVAAFAEFAAGRLSDGRLRAVVDRVLPFDRLADAYAALRTGGLFGKVVVER